HLGVGLGNGSANLHNARRAHSPVVNIVGDHPAEHLPYDAPLTSDIATMARPVSHWVGSCSSAVEAGRATADAIAQTFGPPGRIATLIVADDAMKSDTTNGPVAVNVPQPRIDADAMDAAARALRSGEPAAILLSDTGCLDRGLHAAHRIAAATGCRVLCDTFPARLDRGAGVPPVERLPYFPELVLDRLSGLRHLVLAGAPAPVSFFKYEGQPSSLVPEGCKVHSLAPEGVDAVAALEALAEALNAPAHGYAVTELSTPVAPEGPLDTRAIGRAIGAVLREGAIIADESATSGGPTYFLTQGCPPHSSMYLTGGGIGWGMPAATGAAIARPDAQVFALQGDGGGMYTLQALWTQAREGLNVTTIIFANRRYQILRTELARAGVATMGPRAGALTDLTNPVIDWVSLAKGMGVPATRPETAEDFYQALRRADAEPGPHLIEAVID
ncbi:MAG: acetolactate synthase large subunit, partial [Candidatus Hydrogenedentales bacterium]